MIEINTLTKSDFDYNQKQYKVKSKAIVEANNRIIGDHVWE